MRKLWTSLLLIPGLVFADVMEDLLIAARNDNRGVVRTLLNRGMDANAVIDENANSILMVAAREGSETVVTELLARGAHLDARNRFCETAFMLAAYHGHRTMSSSCLSAAPNSTTHGHAEMVRLLLDHGADQRLGTKPARQR